MLTTQNVTVAEIATQSLAAVRVFEGLGIDYCCGGKRPLDEVCREMGYSTADVQRQLDEAMSANTAPARDWNTAPLSDLIRHIVSTHHAYVRRELPTLTARLAKVHRVYIERNGERLEGLLETFDGLRGELEMHMHKEEMILFPTVEAYEAAAAAGKPLPSVPFGTVENPIRMMEHEHDNAGDALARMRRITNDYEVPEYACVTYRALLEGLKEFEQDLHMHIHLENNVLFPRAASLEQAQA